MSRGRSKPRIDLSFGPGHGPISGALNAAGATMGATMLLALGDGHPMWGLAAGCAMTMAGVLVAMWYAQPGRVLAYRAACWSGAGFWSFWTLSGFRGVRIPFTDVTWLDSMWSPGTPWSWRPTYVLLIGAATAAAFGWNIQRAEDRAAKLAEQQASLTDAQRRAAIEAELAARTPVSEQERIAFREEPVIRRITRKPIKVLNVEIWDPNYGHTLDCELPDDGTTVADIKPHEEAIATSLNLLEGCGVEILRNEGLGRRAMLIKVTTESALGADIHLPANYTAETIENPIAIGVETDRRVAKIPLRYESMVLVGNTDSGKSNQLNAICAGLARCTDALMVGIDLSGTGRFVRPWLRPYVEGRSSRPAFAYVADNDVTAALLCTSLIQIIDGRTADYAPMMHAEGADKIMPRPTLPQIMLIIDEFGKLPDQVKDLVKTITDTGRGAAVRVVSCALEATGTYLPRAIITQSRVRLSMRVVDEAQLQYLFDTTWRRGRFDPASLPWKGSGMYTVGPKFPDKFKGYRVEPAQVDEIAVAVGDLRPDLDAASLRRGDKVTLKLAGPDGYRIEQTFDGVLSGNAQQTYPRIFPATAMANTGRRETPMDTTPGRPDSGPASTGPADLGGTVQDLNNVLQRARKAADDADKNRPASPDDDTRPGDPGDPTVAELNAMLAMPAAKPGRAPAGDKPADPIPPRPPVPPRKRVMQLIREAADRGGIGPGDIHATLAAEGYPTSLTTINNWLRVWKAAGKVDQPGGERTPWYPGPDTVQ